MVIPKQLIDDNIIRNNPADPSEVAQSLEDIAGEEIPAKSAHKRIAEEPLAGDTAMVSDTCVLLRVQRVEKGASDQVRRPDHRGWRNEVAAGDSSDRETDLWRLGKHRLRFGFGACQINSPAE